MFENFINRDISWLDFNFRVLEEGFRKENPLIEKLKFLGISYNNLDEFFKIRIPLIFSNSLDNKQILNKLNKFINIQSEEVNNLIEFSKEHNIFEIVKFENLNNLQIFIVEKKIEEIKNKIKLNEFCKYNLNCNVLNFFIKDSLDKNWILELPKNRVIDLGENKYIFLEEVIKNKIDIFFKDEVRELLLFKATKSDIIKNEKTNSFDCFLKESEFNLSIKKYNEFTRLEVLINSDYKELSNLISIKDELVFEYKSFIDHRFIFDIYKLITDIKVKRTFEVPNIYERLYSNNIFKQITRKDIIMQHPFESHENVIKFIEHCVRDEFVTEIKQTIYRCNNRLIEALKQGASNGKKIIVLFELTAQSDEENNIKCSKELIEAGCIVHYGIKGLKTHGKFFMATRMEGEKEVKYLHIGTGNYNNSSNDVFVDISLFTKNESFCEDIENIFNNLIYKEEFKPLKTILSAPFFARNEIYNKIDKEINKCRMGKKGKIVFKVNGISDTEIINKLYEASLEGVEVIVISRGVCCMKKSISKNIKIYSLVGSFLEHSRIYMFGSDEIEVLVGSIDCMPSKLDRRVDLLYPVIDTDNKNIIIKLINDMLSDNVRLRKQEDDTTYKINIDNNIPFDYQENYYNHFNKVKKPC